MESKFIAFYSSRPFWAGKPLELDKPEVRRKFTNHMSEEVFAYENELFSFKVCRDGMLMIKITELEQQALKNKDAPIEQIIKWYSKYLEYANCLHLIIDSCLLKVENTSYLELSEITNKDAFRISFENGKLKAQNIATESISSLFQMMRFPSAVPFKSLIYYARLTTRKIISKETFDLTAESFSKAVKDEILVEMLSIIAKSISEYKVGNFSIAIILSWFVIESKLNKKWQLFLDEKNIKYNNGTNRINSDRKKRFTGRDYTISIITNYLELSDILSFSIFKNIDKVRGYRNAIAHRDKRYICKPTHCKLAIETALNLALEDKSFKITPNLNYSINSS